MRTLYLLLSIYTGLFLTACSTAEDPDTTAKNQHTSIQQAQVKPKNPLAIKVYSEQKSLNKPYTVLGKAAISRFNPGGIKRQEAYMREAMRDLAASMGGDAVINLDKNGKMVTGTVITFQTQVG